MKKKQKNNNFLLVWALKQINEDAWCYRTYWKAKRNFWLIQDKLTKEEAEELKQLLILYCDPENPDHSTGEWGGMEKSIASDYIKKLIIKYEEK